jgi:hypothetical protein
VVHGCKYKEIHKITGVSVPTIKRIRALHRRTGYVVKKRVIDGGPRLLNGFHISASTFSTSVPFRCLTHGHSLWWAHYGVGH